MVESSRGSGFDARVEPFWMDFSRRAETLGFWKKWSEKRRLNKLVSTINQTLKSQGTSPDGWDARSGECISNLRVARYGLISELQKHVQDATEGSEWPHLMALREGATLTLPVEFDRPFKAGNMAITSAPCLRTELEEINKLIGLDPSFRKKKMVDFMNAGLEDISKYESRAGTQEGFWARFFFVMLWKLVERSIENRLPAILS